MNRLLLVAGLLLSATGCTGEIPTERCTVTKIGLCDPKQYCGVICVEGVTCDVRNPVIGGAFRVVSYYCERTNQ